MLSVLHMAGMQPGDGFWPAREPRAPRWSVLWIILLAVCKNLAVAEFILLASG